MESRNARAGIFALLFVYAASTSVAVGACDTLPGAWLAVLLAGAAAALPLAMFICAVRSSGKASIGDSFIALLGRTCGKAACLLLFAAAIFAGAWNTSLIAVFASETSLVDIPSWLTTALAVLAAAAAACSGGTGAARIARFAAPVAAAAILLSLALSLPFASETELLVLPSAGSVMKNAWTVFTQLFPGTVIAAAAYGARSCRTGNADNADAGFKAISFKWAAAGLAAAAILVAGVAARNAAVLGSGLLASDRFPSYTCAGIVSVGEYIQRTESVSSAVFVAAVTLKTAICAAAAAAGLSAVLPTGMRKCTALSAALIWVCAQMIPQGEGFFDAAASAGLYILPATLGLPLVLWSASIVRRLTDGENAQHRRKSKKL